MRESNEYCYWKLREDFFDSEPILSLERMPDGLLYSNLLMKLCLKSLKHNGELRQEDGTPCTPRMLAAITRHQVETVERALRIFHRLGLAEYLPDGVWRMTGVENLTVRLPDKCLRDRTGNSEGQKEIAPLGRFRNVILTGQELARLREEFPAMTDAYIDRLSKYMRASGRQYPNHAATLRRWMAEDTVKAVRICNGTGAAVGYDHDYSVGEDETV